MGKKNQPQKQIPGDLWNTEFFCVLNSNDCSTVLSLCFNFWSCCLMLVQLKDLVNVELAQASMFVLTTLEPWQLIPTI